MRAKYLLTIITGLLLGTTTSRAQMGLGKVKDIDVLKSQPLIVVLKDEDPKELKKLANKPEDLAVYQGYIASYNAQMQELVPKLWKFSPAVEFKHEADLPALRKAKGVKYGVLRQAAAVTTHRRYSPSANMPGGMGNTLNYTYSSDQVLAFTLAVYGDGEQNRVWLVQVAPGPIYASDIIFSVRTLQTYVQSRVDSRSGADMRAMIDANGKRLPTKILLIDEQDLKNNLTTADIKQAYPFPYQVVSRQAIEQAVSTADSRYAYIRVLPVTESDFVQVAVEAATSDLLAISLPVGINLRGGSVVSKASLKDFAKAGGK